MPGDARTILVTGASDGLGRFVARELAAGGATVLVHGRDPGRGNEAQREVEGAAQGGKVTLHLADLGSLDEVRRLAADVERETERLDVLVNNAGIGAGTGGRELSSDGFERRFAVNYLSQFLLTHLLLPLLRRSAPARIVNVASIGQHPIDFDDPMIENGYDGFRAYSQSKLAQIMFTIELANRLEGEEVTVNALHPATLMDTRMVRESFGPPRSTVAEGARATLRLISDPDLEKVTGRYFDGLREARANRQAYDAKARQKLWELSEELCGLEG